MRHPRIIRLSAPDPGQTVRFLSDVIALASGQNMSVVTVTRAGTFTDPRYGTFTITAAMLDTMVKNFSARVTGKDIFIDVAHRPDDGAAARVVALTRDGDRLRATVEWTPMGITALQERGFRYLSAEYHENYLDNETGARHGATLLGAGLTNRPVIGRLDPIQLSQPTSAGPTIMTPDMSAHLATELRSMWNAKITALLALYKLSAEQHATVMADATKQLSGVTDELQADAILAALGAGLKLLAAPPQPSPAGAPGLTLDDVRRLLAEERAANDAATKKLADDLSANRKLLDDTIAGATGLDDELKTRLSADVADLITADMSADQVKALAANQIKHGNDLAAARQLTARGFTWPAGNVQISVDSSNVIKSLQETADRRLGIAGLPPAVRYRRTGGELPAANRALAEQCLAAFDVEHGHRLAAEHRQLSAGDGTVSDVAIPGVFERTVLRESLYALVGLQFVNGGTAPYTTALSIPYSYRDTSAAGRSNTRKYEGQAISRAGMIQTADIAYPIPQKISFEVSDELRYLTSNGQLDWDVLAENTGNAARIIGEDLDLLLFNEALNASDQYATAAVTSEATATANGTNTIFVTNQFPVVRPKKLYDLQGTQIGSTLYPVTVVVNSVTLTEYDGTGTQSAGTYYWMDYNLGEVHIVNQAGTPVAPTNTHTVVCSYTYTTNVYKFDSDLGSVAADVHWDTFLYRYGLRKAALEDRIHLPNYGLMSSTLREQIAQARQFGANYAREGTNLTTDGNLGMVRGVPNYKTHAPGLAMADNRLVIGERGQTRLRMMKPWSMSALENQKDSNGRFTGKKEAYGDQFIAIHTPTPLKAAFTSMVVYSATARVDRAS